MAKSPERMTAAAKEDGCQATAALEAGFGGHRGPRELGGSAFRVVTPKHSFTGGLPTLSGLPRPGNWLLDPLLPPLWPIGLRADQPPPLWPFLHLYPPSDGHLLSPGGGKSGAAATESSKLFSAAAAAQGLSALHLRPFALGSLTCDLRVGAVKPWLFADAIVPPPTCPATHWASESAAGLQCHVNSRTGSSGSRQRGLLAADATVPGGQQDPPAAKL
ncbi:hypothetical protein MRX96_000396 [Rhipicephalus microplus]